VRRMDADGGDDRAALPLRPARGARAHRAPPRHLDGRGRDRLHRDARTPATSPRCGSSSAAAPRSPRRSSRSSAGAWGSRSSPASA
jgi:hypothetical protein